MTKLKSCPVSVDRVDENTLRIAAFLIVMVLSIGILLKSQIVILLLAADFGLRAFTPGKYSFIRAAAKRISFYAGLKKKHTDAARKKFAAGLGMVFSILIAFFLIIENTGTAYVLGLILGICALLEGLFAFCVGCQIYSWLIVPFYKPQQVKNS